MFMQTTYRLQASSQKVMIHPSSVLHGRKPPCIIFEELLRTTRSYARNVTVIEASWLPETAPMYFCSKSTATAAPLREGWQ